MLVLMWGGGLHFEEEIKAGMIEGYKGNTALDRPGIKCGYVKEPLQIWLFYSWWLELILPLPVMIPKYSFQKKKFEKQGEVQML